MERENFFGFLFLLTFLTLILLTSITTILFAFVYILIEYPNVITSIGALATLYILAWLNKVISKEKI